MDMLTGLDILDLRQSPYDDHAPLWDGLDAIMTFRNILLHHQQLLCYISPATAVSGNGNVISCI
jgi:hypothetical protein